MATPSRVAAPADEQAELIGRGPQLAELRDMLARPECRLVTVTGPGGIGKTRLAAALAGQAGADYADGAPFVPLHGVRSADLLASAVAEALGAVGERGADPRDTLLHALRGRHTLLVLDNFEQLTAGAGLLSEMLDAAPRLKLLVTSRELLRLEAEWLYPLEGLGLPRGPEEAADAPAAHLFVARARQIRPDLDPRAEAAAIARICRLVGGMPLAIELAAAWARTMSCAAIADEVERGLGLLTSRRRDAPERHSSVRAVFDQAWGLLDAGARSALEGVSVFRGGFTRESAQAVAGAGLRELAALADRSLLRAGPDGRHEPHELLRQYAEERLAARPAEAAAAAARHAAHFAELADGAERGLTGPEQAAWLERLTAEHANLRAAIASALAAGDPETALRLTGGLWRFWWLRGHVREGLGLTQAALALPAPAGPPSKARAWALNGCGLLALAREDLGLAEGLLREALAAQRARGDERGEATVLGNLAIALHHRGELAPARALYAESLALQRRLGNRLGEARALNNIGNLDTEAGEFAAARAGFAASRSIYAELGDTWGLASATSNLANAYTHLGDYESARALYLESLRAMAELGTQKGTCEALEGLALVAERSGQPGPAAQIFAAVAAQRAASGQPGSRDDAARYAAAAARARAALGPDAEPAGAGLSLADAVALAASIGPPAGGAAVTPGPDPAPAALSERELEVLGLIRAGLSNHAIADRLSLSVGTVKWHTWQLYGKLGVGSRTKALARAEQLGLLG